ncbi:type I restriction-modification system subunit M [Kaistella jeonii]|uniref:site-specific DNA-methyltransferase (adenine-specific) n=1 Tax=Kaistella jeonii TaxID=266749 RepID=A0A0C1CZQ5_9FLAO|nr:type I restriction-modification system subunit M [Kaistella jeonii]KIA89911.1 restriction endonuclease subunit M [Kaistella jeonii]
MSEEQKRLLEQKLWDIANALRGKIDADAYRDYILGFIFYKYLSEKLYLKANSLLKGEEVEDYYLVKDEETLEAIKEETLESLGYFLEPEELFDFLVVRGQRVNNATTAIRGYSNILIRVNGNTKALGSVKTKVNEEDFEIELIDRPSSHIIEDLEAVLRKIEQSTMGTESQEDFDALFEDIDLASTKLGRTPDKRNEIVVEIITKLSEIDFKLEDINSDVLGDAYEYLIAKFASTAGKSAGEFYTPQQISKILAKIVTDKKQRLKNVYDPTCGSGSLLLRVAKETDVTEFFGQEMNRTTFNLARMNMLLHDVHYSRFDIENDDTLEEPKHLEQRFEAIVANPPFSAHWKADNNPLHNTDERFSQFGKLAPKTKADFAFLQHMYYQLSDNGTLASVFPHGILFRGSSEGLIRKYFIDKLNAIDAVIGLPGNLFYGTSIPACIIVLKKCRKVDDNIVFIDASAVGNYVKIGNQNELRDEDVERIVNAYYEREHIDKFCAIVSFADIKKNDYNLNVPRYVDVFEIEERIDIEEIAQKLKALEKEIIANDSELSKYCTELGISTPF